MKVKVKLTLIRTLEVDPEDFDFSLDEEGLLLDEDGERASDADLLSRVEESIENDPFDYFDDNTRGVDVDDITVVEIK